MFNKKGAMFGLVLRRSRQGFSQSRALKKQFGKLFLVRMQSVDSQETRVAGIQSSRAAMFGLDARIALAIFGALSVISGAALYSAIQSAKSEAINQNLREIEKAIQAYILDIGSMADYSSNTHLMELSCLVDNYGNCSAPAAFWKGPYIPGSTSTGVYWALNTRVTGDSNLDGYFEAHRLQGATWSGTSASAPDMCTGSDCYMFLMTQEGNHPSGSGDATNVAKLNSLFTQMDAYLDNGDGERAGRVRKANPVFGGTVGVYFKTSIPEKQDP